MAGLILRDRVQSCVTRRWLGVEQLLHRINKIQLRWLRHLIWKTPGCLPLEVFGACLIGMRNQGRPRLHCPMPEYPFWHGTALGWTRRVFLFYGPLDKAVKGAWIYFGLVLLDRQTSVPVVLESYMHLVCKNLSSEELLFTVPAYICIKVFGADWTTGSWVWTLAYFSSYPWCLHLGWCHFRWVIIFSVELATYLRDFEKTWEDFGPPSCLHCQCS